MFPWLVLGMGFCACYDTRRRLADCLPKSQARNLSFFANFSKKGAATREMRPGEGAKFSGEAMRKA
jgi:hypothetical protein